MLFYTHNPSKFAFSRDATDFENLITSRSKTGDKKNQGPAFALLGVPFDGTTTYLPGARFGPAGVREASYNFEKYNLTWDCVIDSLFFDLGNVEVIHGNFKKTCTQLQETISELLSKDVIPLLIGGEHSISYAMARALKLKNIFNEVTVVHFDAHMDMIDSYMGEKYSHATVMRRISELNPRRIIQLGVRSASFEEKEFVDEMGIEYYTAANINDDINHVKEVLSSINGPIYLTIDMDVFDPSEAPSVGNPTPCGIKSHQMEKFMLILSKKNVVALDVVEAASDKMGDLTSVNAAKIILDFICLQR